MTSDNSLGFCIVGPDQPLHPSLVSEPVVEAFCIDGLDCVFHDVSSAYKNNSCKTF